jgi:hypothetical protein
MLFVLAFDQQLYSVIVRPFTVVVPMPTLLAIFMNWTWPSQKA